MLSYYRTLFDINERSDGDGLAGLPLMQDVEERLRIWVSDFFPNHPDILEDPGDVKSGRMWEDDGALLRLSGNSVEEHGYFWLRWHVDDGGGNDYRRYLGFRLATEGDSVQADVELRVANRKSGHFDSEVRKVMETLLSRYRCSTLGTGLSSEAVQLQKDRVTSYWEHLSSPERCLPVVMVSEKRGGGMPLDSDALQRDLMGLAEVAYCSDEIAWLLGWHTWDLLCYDGQVRIYAPGLGVGNNDERLHRLWSSDDVSELGYDALLQSLRDECSQRIYYPEGRDALRVFSRVRGRVRDRIRTGLNQENRQIYDEWAEEVSAKDDEIKHCQERLRLLEEEKGHLQMDVVRLERENRRLNWRLQSSESRTSDGYGAPDVGGNGDPRSNVKTVAGALNEIKTLGWTYVRVFEQVAKDCANMSAPEAKAFFDVLERLNDCGEGRLHLTGESESSWMSGQGFNFASRESEATMNRFGDTRCFKDDNGDTVEMQAHIRVGRKLRVHLCWSEEETRWLVGYFGGHLPTDNDR